MRRADHLDGDNSIQAPLLCPVDHSHPAAGDFVQELVITDQAVVVGHETEGHVLVGRRKQARKLGQLKAAFPKGRGQVVELTIRGEELGQIAGEVGVIGEQRLAVGAAPVSAASKYDASTS